MSKQRIIDYVMNTPGNTNPNVLNSLLDEEMNDLPPIGPEDKNKYLHTNESTGALEWAEGGSGGGFEQVVFTKSSSGGTVDFSCSHTYEQIDAAKTAGALLIAKIVNATEVGDSDYYGVLCYQTEGLEPPAYWVAINMFSSGTAKAKITSAGAITISFGK